MTLKLSSLEIHDALKNLGEWHLIEEEHILSKEYQFKDFAQAFSFMTQVALYAEKVNHHPEWANNYNKIQVKLSSHDAGGISKKDIELALYMDEVAFCFLNPCMLNDSDLVF